MRKIWIAIIAMLVIVPVALAQSGIVRPTPQAQELAYGRDPLQKLDYWHGTGRDAPLILFVHGGGWWRGDKRNATGAAKIQHFNGAGYAFASVNYRLVPNATVEEQAQDVADAVAFMITQARRLNIDSRKIVLMGHSAGAHLAALVGTDPRYLRKAGLSPSMLGGVVLLDGAAYDVVSQSRDAGPWLGEMYDRAFGSDPARQRALSPVTYVARPNADSFLILHVDRPGSPRQAHLLGDGLRAAGTPAKVALIADSNHMKLKRNLGNAGDPATALVDAYAASIFAYKGDWKAARLVPVAQ